MNKKNINLQPIVLLPARERVASVLRKAIISQDIKSGVQLTLDSVAEQLGVSITPVREAFQMLEHEGLLEHSMNKGATVKGITPRSVMEHFQIRAALESEAVFIVCSSGVDLTEIRNVVDQAQKVIDKKKYDAYSNLNQAFHIAIWNTSNNMRLKNMLSVMWNGLAMRYMETVAEYAIKSHSEHKAIIEAMEKGDVMAASTLMHRHIERSMNDMLTNLENKTSE